MLRLSNLASRISPFLVLLMMACVPQAGAQGMSVFFGAGSATDGRATTPGCPTQQISDPFSGLTPPASCVPAPRMSGAFGVFGADFMITSHLGFGGEYSFPFAQTPYLPSESLNVRPQFYDFNAIYQPTSGGSRVVPVLEGGIGGSKLSYYVTQTSNVFNQSSFVASSSHFQVHGAVGIKLYINSDIFVKPQVDLRWVDHLNQQYNQNFVPEYTISIGYTFGRR